MGAGRILVVDDKETMRSLFQRILPGRDVATAGDGAKALAILASGEPLDVVVSDIRMPGLDGMALLAEARRVRPEVEVILMTAFGTVPDAVAAMKAGAFDYLVKPFDPDEAVLAIDRALEVRRLRERAARLQRDLDLARGFGPFVGESEAIRRVFGLLDKAAAVEATVLLLGESGTGKELAARAIHDLGARRDGAFVAVHGGALPEGLAESELFGHLKGSFTGAISDKPGLFEEARGGTLLLDEVASIPLALQVKLNRALEQREARRVGATRPYPLDVRVIAASNVDLKDEAAGGRFREDLYFRLNVLAIRLPPLRDRREDIPLLAAHFLKALSRPRPRSLAPEALKALLSYAWPGNVRELRNAIERAVAVADGERIGPSDLPPEVAGAPSGLLPADHLARLTYAEAAEVGRDLAVRQYLDAVMRSVQGNVTAAAPRAGVERETLHRLLKKHGLDAEGYRA